MHDLMLQELRLFTDCGRCCRPLFIVDLESQRLAVTKQEIGLLQDRDSTGFGWSVSLCTAALLPTCLAYQTLSSQAMCPETCVAP